MGRTLATKYRPKTFEEVVSQKSIVTILKKQVEIEKYSNTYLFSGPSGIGKTTLARIFANEINKGQGYPIEIDGASNNGVDNIREISQNAKERSINSEYKIYIIDECHMITSAGWNAFLKTLEEPPKYTIFMFATTDVQKIPPTILNRLMRFNLNRIPTEEVKDRLKHISALEGFTNYEESIDFISKLANGGMRDAISMLEKAASFSSDLSIQNVLKSIGNLNYDTLFNLTNKIIDGDEKGVVTIIEEIYSSGADLKVFVDSYFEFLLDLTKYTLFNSMEVLKIPASFEESVKYTTGIKDNTSFFNKYTNKLLDLKNSIQYETSIKNIILITLLNLSRGN